MLLLASDIELIFLRAYSAKCQLIPKGLKISCILPNPRIPSVNQTAKAKYQRQTDGK